MIPLMAFGLEKAEEYHRFTLGLLLMPSKATRGTITQMLLFDAIQRGLMSDLN